jgi:hypothetical protein
MEQTDGGKNGKRAVKLAILSCNLSSHLCPFFIAVVVVHRFCTFVHPDL